MIGQAAIGAIAGWTIGSAQVGRGLVSPLRFYDPVPVRMAVSSVLDAWIVQSRMVRLDIPPHLCAAQYLDSWRYPAGAAGFGLANLRRGVPPPLSGALDNPLAERAEALGRATFWGLAHYGDPDAAVSAALYDASFDHSRDGVWCAAAVAWIVSHTAAASNLSSLLASLAGLLPPDSRFMVALPIVRNWIGQPDGFIHGINACKAAGVRGDAVGTLCAALLASGGGDFGSCVGSATTGDCDRSTAGLVAGVLAALRFGSVPPEWVSPLGEAYIGGTGLRGIDPPQAISDFAEMVIGSHQAIKSSSSPGASIVSVAVAEEPTPQEPAPLASATATDQPTPADPIPLPTVGE
ncbi:MAG: ADP-ribosylglycohydrolase family protein, partial [Armatimonadota bacterium]